MRKMSLGLVLFAAVITGCGSLTVKEIPPNEVPEGLWDGDGSIYVSSFRLNDPTVQKVKKVGDCPGQRIAHGDRRAYCAETRVRDTEQNCNLVFSTYGEGYCPPTYDYQSAANNQSMQSMDTVVSAGTAAQNAILAWGEKVALEAQVTSKKLITENLLSSEVGSATSEQDYKEVTETVIETTQNFRPLALIARTRRGFYSDCLLPKFEYTGVYMNSSYYRIEPNELACKLEADGHYLPGYYNTRTNNKEKTSMVGFLALKPKDSAFDICMKDSIMGMCIFTKEGVTEPTDFELVRGFVEKTAHPNIFVALESISEHEITITVQIQQTSGQTSTTSHSIPSDGNYHQVNGLNIAVIARSDGDTVTLDVQGQITY